MMKLSNQWLLSVSFFVVACGKPSVKPIEMGSYGIATEMVSDGAPPASEESKTESAPIPEEPKPEWRKCGEFAIVPEDGSDYATVYDWNEGHPAVGSVRRGTVFSRDGLRGGDHSGWYKIDITQLVKSSDVIDSCPMPLGLNSRYGYMSNKPTKVYSADKPEKAKRECTIEANTFVELTFWFESELNRYLGKPLTYVAFRNPQCGMEMGYIFDDYENFGYHFYGAPSEGQKQIDKIKEWNRKTEIMERILGPSKFQF